MPWYPGAVKRQISGRTNGPMRSHRGIVLHCNDANSASLYDWIMRPNPSMSCHFQVFLDGTIEQYMDTTLSSWCQGGGNDDWLSLETSGKAGAPLTDAQMKTIPALLAWAADVHDFPLQLADTPSGRGLGWHGMAAAVGDKSWGHSLCPGVRREQRPELLARAAGHLTTDPNSSNPADSVTKPAPVQEDDDMALLITDSDNKALFLLTGGVVHHLGSPNTVTNTERVAPDFIVNTAETPAIWDNGDIARFMGVPVERIFD